MKTHKRVLVILMVTILMFLLVFLAFFKKDILQFDNDLAVWNDTETDTQWQDSEGLEDGENTQETEEVELSYIELYGLEKVDKPVKRTKEEVLERLAELSEEFDLVRQVYENADAYADIMLERLANNPEMAAYVLGVLDADGSVTGGLTPKELEEGFPLLLQFDPRWGYFDYGGKEMAINGCGPTCLAMTVLALTDEEDVTPDKVVTYSLDKGYYVPNVGTAWKLIDEFPTQYGLIATHPSIKETSMKAELDKEKVLICSMRAGEFTTGGHFIVIYGYDEAGFYINDPQCVARSRRIWEFEEFGDQIKRIWAIGEASEEDLKKLEAESNATTTQPTVNPDESDVTPEQPAVIPEQPVDTPAQPVVTPTPPATTPEQPVVTPTPPATTPEQPVVTPTPPATTPEQPSETPEQPAETPTPPAETPEQPSVTPTPPAETPEQPSVTPEQPSVTPEQPAETPTPPAESPEQPTVNPGETTTNP